MHQGAHKKFIPPTHRSAASLRPWSPSSFLLPLSGPRPSVAGTPGTPPASPYYKAIEQEILYVEKSSATFIGGYSCQRQ